MFTSRQSSGFSLVEVIVVSAVMVIFFAGLITMVLYVIDMVQNARAKLSALSVATERIEFIRSLPYDSVGTVAGIPNGTIPQNRTVKLNNYTFSERVLIEYVDDDADGTLGTDSNGIIADYKRVKVEYTWNVTGATSSMALVSTIVPRSIETTAGGGTIRVNVFDAAAVPVGGASVRLLNTTGTSTVDVTRFTDAAGVALFAGAPAGSNYQIFASKTGYSSDQTYVSTTSNPSPLTLPVTVLDADVSTMNFQIDRVSGLTVQLYSAYAEANEVETFAAATGIATTSDAVLDSGAIRLAGSAGSYAAIGNVFLVETAPATNEAWRVLTVAASLPAQTSYRVRLYTGTSTTTLIPDTDLPGNASGFTSRLIDISDLSVGAYPTFTVGIELASSDPGVTPTVSEVGVHYVQSSTPRANSAFSLRGNKLIGAGVYKFDSTQNTNGSGVAVFTDQEWDIYTVSVSGNQIALACPDNPFVLPPNETLTVEALVENAATHNLRVVVRGDDGLPVPGAAVLLSRGAYTSNQSTNSCGQTFYDSGSIVSAADYQLEVTAEGFTTSVIDPLTISGDSVATVTLSPL